LSWRELAPEPARHWIRFSPKRWPATGFPSLDLAERRIIWPGGARDVPLPEPPLARLDLVYLPPVPRERRAERERWIVDYERQGGAALVQIDVEEALEPAATGTRVVDLLAQLLVRDPAPLAALPGGVAAVLPLLPGLSPEAGAWRPWLAALAARGRRQVCGVAVELTPPDRRRLAELSGEAAWEAIFHGEAPSEREFARSAAHAGLEPFPLRPDVALAPRRRRNRELATRLAEAGDLWLRLRLPEADGQALLAAARHVEATALDLASLAREGNLGVVSWLSPLARELIADQAAGGRAERFERLKGQYLTPAEAGGEAPG
jgi:hypothetical protein